MPVRPAGLVALAAALCFLAGSSRAQSATECLIAPISAEFKLAAQPQHTGAKILVFLPENETTQNWTEQIAVQTFLNKAGCDPVAALRAIGQKWVGACKASKPI